MIRFSTPPREKPLHWVGFSNSKKKSKTGIKTAKSDVDLIGKRLKRASQHYAELYTQTGGKGKRDD